MAFCRWTRSGSDFPPTRSRRRHERRREASARTPCQPPPVQQDMPCCTGGHLTVPYEQYTQQSPGSGWKIAWQDAHSWTHRHALVGMVSRVDHTPIEQVITDSSSTDCIGKPRCASISEYPCVGQNCVMLCTIT